MTIPSRLHALRVETLMMSAAFLLVLALTAGLVGEARGDVAGSLDTSRKTECAEARCP